MLFNWFKRFSVSNKEATLKSIFICSSAGQTMFSVEMAEAIENRGLKGDRYFNKQGYWDPVEGCQVTLISCHDIKLAQSECTLNLNSGIHRRNLVIEGIKTKSLEGQTFQIGSAVFAYEKPRPPCGYLNKIEGRGLASALSYNSGICIRVIKSGQIKAGDRLKLISSI